MTGLAGDKGARAPVLLTLLTCFGILATSAAHGQPTALWYYCDPSYTYYPYVSTCSAPWRPVVPSADEYKERQPLEGATGAAASQSPSPDPELIAPAASKPPDAPEQSAAKPSAAFQQGQADRQSWEAWFAGLTGESRAGADYWAAHRSTSHRKPCDAAPPSTGADWTDGCLAAQTRLNPADARRKTEPEYRLGWNNPSPIIAPPEAAEPKQSLDAAPPPSEPPAAPANSVPPSAEDLKPQLPSPEIESALDLVLPVTRPAQPRDEPSAYQPTYNWTGGHLPGAIVALILVAITASVILASVSKKREIKRLEELTIQTAATEIELGARNLRIRRMQLVQPDRYGTIFLDKWEAEKQYYLKTRILPQIEAKGLMEWYGSVAFTIERLIEEAAQRPLASGDLEVVAFLSDPEIFDARMDPLDYERHCALQLEKAGWSTRLTATTGDQGADVIAHRNGKILVVQCKLYSQPVGNDAVQQVHAARSFQSADIAAVVSNQPFTKSARELANVNGVYLLHHEELCRFIG
jgi:restriction system protein